MGGHFRIYDMGALVKLTEIEIGKLCHIPSFGVVRRLKDYKRYQQVEWNGKAMTIYTKQLVEKL